MKFIYNSQKNAELLSSRGMGFEEIISAISDGQLLDIRFHHNIIKYPNQKILYVRILKEVYAVPCVQEIDGSIFLKTLFASRKARKQFLESNK